MTDQEHACADCGAMMTDTVLGFVCGPCADRHERGDFERARREEHSDGGTCCECGEPHECRDCPTFKDSVQAP